MTFFETFILGIVEGITEYLPISSTGHLIITEHFLGIVEDAGAKTFAIAIQLGEILAVLILYWQFLLQKITSLAQKSSSQRFFVNLFLSFLPAAMVCFFVNGLMLISFRLIGLSRLFWWVEF